jgi:transcriptional regulator with XRE-family HTH domain
MATTYHKLIKTLRLQRGISQHDIADTLGISRASYVSLEQGKRELTLDEAGVLSEVLDIALDDLLSGRDTKYKKYEQMLFAFLRSIAGDGKIPKTKLAKLLYLADFSWFYTHHESMSGLLYRKIKHGPVPDYYFRLLEELDGDGKVTIQPKGRALLVAETRSGEKVGTNLLSTDEKKLIVKIAKKWHAKDTQEIVDFTHNQLPYTFSDEGAIIPYELITQEDPQHVY